MSNYDREADATRVVLVGRSPDGGVTPGAVQGYSVASDGRADTEKGQLDDNRNLLYTPAGVWDRMRGNALRDLLVQQRDLVTITNTGAASASVTLTIPAGAAGVFNYLVYLQIVLYGTAAMAGAATPFVVTTTGILGTPSFTFPTALAIGTVAEQKYEGGAPIKGTAAATAMTVVAPVATSGIWRITAAYFKA